MLNELQTYGLLDMEWQADTVTGWEVTNGRTWLNHFQERKRNWGG